MSPKCYTCLVNNKLSEGNDIVHLALSCTKKFEGNPAKGNRTFGILLEFHSYI